MAEVIRMPQLSDTMEEGVIVKWHKKVGDPVESGEILAEVETDKATMEMECFEEGTLLHIGIEEGESVPVDAVIAVVGEEGEDYKALLEQEQPKAEGKEQEADAKKSEKKTDASGEGKQNAKPSGGQAATEKSASQPATEVEGDGSRIRISPLARKMVDEHGLDVSAIKGTGDHGRIVRRDIEQALEAGTGKAVAVAAEPAGAQEGYEDVKVSMMRKTIASRLSESKFTSPHFYLNVDVTMDEAMKARKQMMEATGEKLSFNDLVVKASALALRKHPDVNASWMGDKIRYYKHIHVGVAVAVEEGLLVPVVRFADGKGVAQIAQEVRDYADRAHKKELEPKDWEGNTFTISNLGMFGIDDFTAIINPPDACIMAVGAIKEVPVAHDGAVTTAHKMRVTLSCDHRVVDGVIGARFLQTFRQYLEAPVSMLA